MLHRGLETLGKSLSRFSWIIIVIWIALIGVSGWLITHYSSVLSGGGWDIPKSESLKVQQMLVEQFDGRSKTSLLLIFQDRESKSGERAYQDKLTKMMDFIGKEEGVESTYSLLNAAELMKPRMVSNDGHTTYAFINMNVDEDYAVKLMPGIQKRYVEYAKENGVKSYLIGNSALLGDISVYSQEGLKRAEMIVFPLIFIILLFVFRSIVAAITPILITVAAVVSGMGIIYLVGSQVEMSVFVSNSAIMLGLGIGIDYSLFMVSRFRQELARHKDVNQAMGITMRTSGHTVLFSGITVFAALIALFVINVPAIKAIAFGSISVLVFAVLATLSLLPAVLTLLGERINKGRIPNLFNKDRNRTSLWIRFFNLTMKRPVLFLLVSIILMGIFAIPVKDMKLIANDASILPVESSVRSGLEMYTDSFSTGGTTVNSILVSVDEGRITDEKYLSYLGALQDKLMEQENIKQVSSIAGFVQGMAPQQASAFLSSDPARWPRGLKPMIDRYVSRDGQTAVLDMTFLMDGSSPASQALMEDIRRKIVPESKPPAHLSFAYGGNTPRAVDMNQAIYDGLLPALFIMLGLTFLILIATFRSILLPLKAILLNLLSVGATFGIVTWVFASGHGVEIFGAEANGFITNFVPLLMLALLFGLSTDYEVFLVSRMKEHYEKTGNNEESIKVGIQSTGPLITGAAVLMIAVFTGFAFSSMLPIQTLGFGLAVAILLDSTIVRMIIVPTAMKLLGHLNWWYPGNKSAEKKHGNDE